MRHKVLAEAQESRGRLMTKGMRSEILPRSPAQSTVLFSSGRGGGRRREESINNRASTLDLFLKLRYGSVRAVVQRQEED